MSAEIACADIDVCMIVCNEAGVIERSLSALLDAGFDSFIVIDMESNDDTVERIESLAGQRAQIHPYPRPSLLKHGYAEARNTCASFARREWVLFVDADECLVDGCKNGRIGLTGADALSGIASIERRNLARQDGAVDGAVFVGSVERHNRLYKPSLTERWKGYIHEEIHRQGISGWNIDNHSTLVLEHHCGLKPLPDGTKRSGLYALMLMRAYINKALQDGTNAWWYEQYVPEHHDLLESRAIAYAREENISEALSLPDLRGGKDSRLGGALLRSILIDDSTEAVVGLAVVRRLHSVSSMPWTSRSERVLWGEWDHPGEAARSLTSIIEATRSFNWHRFIGPGKVCIDIGGHSGDTALPMALYSYDNQIGKRGQVIVVEPNPAVIPVLDVNLTMNTHIGDFYVANVAITKVDLEEVELADHGNAECNGGVLAGGGLSALVESRLQSIATNRYKTRGVSLEKLFKEIECTCRKPVGFIKIDCEGYDKEILRPCKSLLMHDMPVLFVEWFEWFTPDDDADLFSVIDSIGYIPYDPLTLMPANLTVRIPDLLCIHSADHSRSTIMPGGC